MISIITTCRNRLYYLRQTLSSMLIQNTPLEYEVVLVDYNDPENSFSFGLQEAERCNFKNFKSVRVLENTIKWNCSHTRNIGARVASGDYYFFVDSDMIIYPNVIQYLYKRIKEDSFDLLLCDGFFTYRRGCGDATGQSVCSKKMFQEMNGFNELGVGWCMEDADFYLRCIDAKKYIIQSYSSEQFFKILPNPRTLKKRYQKSEEETYYQYMRKTRHNVNPKGFGLGRYKIFSSKT